MGGDHKCPLCSATFTRPQHVGRHLRAHTGDRPYECKECPLRFARSDLLSRHVNKAHKPPDENAPEKKQTKKGRRKSFPATTAVPKPIDSQAEQSPVREKPRAASLSQQPQQAQLQAHSMYPHHPLLTGTATQSVQAQTWNANPSQAFATTAGMTNFSSSIYGQTFVNPVSGTGNPNAILGNPPFPAVPTFDPPFTAAPMRMSGSDQGYGPMGRNSSPNLSGITYEWGFKKRACDQCNHSKVRCDFADPCLRCTHRNLGCSYSKPQRSRTIGYPLAPNTGMVTSPQVPTMSVSPQSHFSSPHSTSSPIAPHEPLSHTAHRKSSVSSLPPNLPQVPTHGNNPSSWNMYPVQRDNNGLWQSMQPSGVFDNAIAVPGNVTGQFQESPRSMDVQLHPTPVYPSLQAGQMQIQGVSPPHATAPTPSLTSNTTSPSDLDEPVERRSSYTGLSGSFNSTQWQGPGEQNKMSGVPTLQTFNNDSTFILPPQISPSQISPTQTYQAQFDNAFQSELNLSNATMSWPQSTGDTQWSQTFTSDDDAVSALSSSANSTFLELNDAQMQNIQHSRRRSSAGTWANALAKMTIQDNNNAASSSTVPPPVEQGHRSRRPTYPTLEGVKEGNEAALEEPPAMPTLSDVKDLWRIFMTEPMSGLTPAGEKLNELDNAPIVTPRPGIGTRSLSKSNSMPDLLSPQVNGPTFFSTFLNGLTPRPMEQQQSYIPTQQPVADGQNAADGPDVNKWSREIQQRQSSFNLKSQVGAKLGKGQQQGSSPSGDAMQPPAPQSSRARPLPSVVQRSSALQQTLAPERVPSFGLPHSFDPQAAAASYSKLGLNKLAHGVTSAEARPGNKRIASQTLIPGDGKKASFTLWDGDASSPETATLPAHTHSGNMTLDPAMFAMPVNGVQNQTNLHTGSTYQPNWAFNAGTSK
ncbi:hypothetical protein CI109_102376 [Kwoniella shandongensis]|uniref:Uncharacterized protein n=1 Tax=Kwoniella shandongensis TaxID=1734106 RepID=A0A5M6C046_9TREE|nr:uncharacterized protein CI109_003304 [Kwoniella shandongensis]KAA5528404.1 hypothetical protein CI109_003304 [Kwoniella shandongensis]